MINYGAEIFRLSSMLDKEKIIHEVRYKINGYQLAYPSFDNCICSATCNKYSYGGNRGLLEISGLIDEKESLHDVLGYLSAEDVFKRIKKYEDNLNV